VERGRCHIVVGLQTSHRRIQSFRHLNCRWRLQLPILVGA